MTRALLQLLFVVATVIAVIQGNCMDKIKEIQARAGGAMLMGGHRRVENPGANDVIKDIAAQGAKEFNLVSNELLQYSSSEIDDAYSQVVAGVKYCVQFQATSNGCKNGSYEEFCQARKKQRCVVSAYQGLYEQYAKIDPASLSCSLSN